MNATAGVNKLHLIKCLFFLQSVQDEMTRKQSLLGSMSDLVTSIQEQTDETLTCGTDQVHEVKDEWTKLTDRLTVRKRHLQVNVVDLNIQLKLENEILF